MQAAAGLQRLTLSNGLRVNLIHDPNASRAAALFQLSAGSHDAPARWPGLAHLLEHVLFAGSENYRAEQRLMAWGPASGARLNATTHAHYTAWFFDIAADRLAEGLPRLVDMLARPLLALESVRQEAAVIDAEFQMLTRHTDTLCEAALSQAIVTPQRLHDFHVGNRQAFGEDDSALQLALKAYHQRFFRADGLELWLQGPQSLETLARLAQSVASAFSPVPTRPQSAQPVLSLNTRHSYGLNCGTAERLCLSFAVAAEHRPLLSMLREMLSDSAAHSLLARLREGELCDSLQLTEPWRSPRQSLTGVMFELCEAANPAAIEAIFYPWLSYAARLESARLEHYARLAGRRFRQLASLDQLRARAFGLIPPDNEAGLAESWQALMATLLSRPPTRLWVSPIVAASPVQVQGFTLNSGIIAWPERAAGSQEASVTALPEPANTAMTAPPPITDAVQRQACAIRKGESPCDHQPIGDAFPDFSNAFYSDTLPLALPPLPDETAPLRQIPASGTPLLLINPCPGEPLTRRAACLIEAALQPVSGLCQHQGGELHWGQQQGIWLLQLSGTPALLQTVLAAVTDALSHPSATVAAQGDRLFRKACRAINADIAIRALLAHLPDRLTGEAYLTDQPADSGSTQETPGKTLTSGLQAATPDSLPDQPWQAVLYGGEEDLHQALSRLLSLWPGGVSSMPETRLPGSAGGHHRVFPATAQDTAVLLFCPLAEISAGCLAAWQLLAALFEPRFFQRLRVELNIGYVVSCRFHFSAGEAGILFALQSPTLNFSQLSHHILDFIADMADFMREISSLWLEEKRADLINALPPLRPENPGQCLEHWGYQQLALPVLTPEIISAMSPDSLQRYFRLFSNEKQRWCWLSNT